jgi:hypothetical protein
MIMNPAEIAGLYSGPGATEQGEQYLRNEGLLEYLSRGEDDDRIPPSYSDLARLHRLVRLRKVFTVLEFGIGYSTLVMADALLKNRADWDALSDRPKLRNSAPFSLHAVDTESRWISVVQCNFPTHLAPCVSILQSGVMAGEFQGRACHYYNQLPDVIPDLIYLDGPDPRAVESTAGNRGWDNPGRVVLSADLLRMEPWLLPGTCVLVDGRTANVRFLLKNLYRDWSVAHNDQADITVLELQEPPLGEVNRNIMRYCLGERIDQWKMGS